MTATPDAQRPDLSIVIPAYNESARLPATLASIAEYIIERNLNAEIIVADDGSDDDTADQARAVTVRGQPVRVLQLAHRGKASAVQAGMLAAIGRTILFTDADLSTPIAYADDLIAALDAGADIAIGSREGLGATRVGEPGYRHIMGRVFNAVVRLLGVANVRDTQCGFKAFRSKPAHDLFRRARLPGSAAPTRGPRVTGFDVEILFLARLRRYVVVEVPVYWEHASGSKVRPLTDSVRMFRDVLMVRVNALRGLYR